MVDILFRSQCVNIMSPGIHFNMNLRWFKHNPCRLGNSQVADYIKTLRPIPAGRHFANDIFKSILLNENCCIGIQISQRFVLQSPINNMPAFVQIMRTYLMLMKLNYFLQSVAITTLIFFWNLSFNLYVKRNCFRNTESGSHLSIGSTRQLSDKVHCFAWTHWGRDKMAAISQTISSNAFSWMKISEFRLRFHWSLFLRFELTIF